MNSWMILVGLMWLQPPVKQEIETSIQKRDVPSAALTFLSTTLSEANDIRYYKESDGQDISFEVKFRLNGHVWSVEFDSAGAFQDAECLVSMNDLSSELTSKILSHLNSRFTSWSANRIQLQFPSWPTELENPTGVEIVVEGQNSSEVGLFEFFFPSDGSAISERRVTEILDF